MLNPKMFIFSPIFVDPFLELITLLRPRAMLTAGIHATGRWAVSFPQREDVLFCWIELGECQLVRAQSLPLLLRPRDFVLIRTTSSFTLASDPSVAPEDSTKIVAETNDPVLRLGEGSENPLVLRGGRFVFDTSNEQLLTGLLPPFVHLRADDTSSSRIHSLLKLNQTEAERPGPASEFVTTRLLEVMFVELLRRGSMSDEAEHSGLIAGLADPITSRALSAMHAKVSQDWTVLSLARVCGVSRSTFATHFRDVVGMSPIEYLLRWRMALARDELRRGTRTVGEIALAIGFQSSSAFSTAFTKATGASPRAFMQTQAT